MRVLGAREQNALMAPPLAFGQTYEREGGSHLLLAKYTSGGGVPLAFGQIYEQGGGGGGAGPCCLISCSCQLHNFINSMYGLAVSNQ